MVELPAGIHGIGALFDARPSCSFSPAYLMKSGHPPIFSAFRRNARASPPDRRPSARASSPGPSRPQPAAMAGGLDPSPESALISPRSNGTAAGVETYAHLH
jgi:hypothetical protein